MHRWLLLLMIALLPVRAWVGDAMAAEMLAWQAGAVRQAVGGSHAMAMPAQPRSHDGGHRGHEFAQQAQAAGEDGGSAQAHGEFSSCASCVSCQACSSAAPAVAMETGQVPAFAFAALSDSRFASADRAPGLKPPIS